MSSGRDSLQELAQFASELRFEDIPTAVIERAQTVFQDTIGVIIGGLQKPELANLLKFAEESYPGKAQIIGTNVSIRPEWASFVYGTAGTTLEFDEGHAFARGHAAIHAVSVALALASAHGLSGKETITAMIAGYEVAARIGVASRLREAVHPFGAWGVIGAGAIGAKIAGFNEEEMLSVFEIAASYAITPSYQTALQGANIRNSYAGFVNHNGLLAVEMFKAGFRGEAGGVETAFGKILGDSFDSSALVDGLGENYEIMRGYIKPYSACRYSHAAVDAVLAVHEQLNPDKINVITVDTYDFAATLSNPNPQTPLAARFSIPYIIATTIYDGDAGAGSFTEGAIRREEVLALAQKVTVQESPEYTAMLPEKRSAKISFHTGDTVLESEAIGSKGDPDKPMSAEEIRGKFDQLTGHFSAEYREHLWSMTGNLAELDTLHALFEVKPDTIK